MAKVSYACKTCGREHTHRGYCWKCAKEYNADPSAKRKHRKDGRGTAAWRRLRALVWLRDEGTCQRCHRSIAEGEAWDLGHIVSASAGGQLTEDNVRLEHVGCNRSAGDRR